MAWYLTDPHLAPILCPAEQNSVRPKPGFGIDNRNQDQVSVSVSGPELFLPKPKLSPILKSTKNSVQLWPERLKTAFRLSRWYRYLKFQKNVKTHFT